jgi:outer membrane protein, heavy metal efflux system
MKPNRSAWIALLVLGGVIGPVGARAQAPDSTVLTLADVERDVLARNPSLAAMKKAAEAASAHAEGAGAWIDPELSFMAAPRSFASGGPGDAYRIELTQRIAPFGRRDAERLEAGARFDEVSADVQSARLDLLRAARVAFAEYRRATESRVAHEAMVELAVQLRQVALAKYAAGTVEQQDPLSASVEAARLTHHGVLLESERRVAAARLNTLLGRPAGAPLPPPAAADAQPVHAMLALDPDSLIMSARGARPEVQAAIARIATRMAQRRVAGASSWPGLMVGIAQDRYWSEPELQTSVELGIDLPLFGGRSSNKLEADAQVAAAEAEHQSLILQVQQEVVEALTRYDESVHDLEVLDQGVMPAATQSVTALRAAYAGNRASFLALLDAARSLAEAQLDRIDAVARRDVARADLARALGDDGGMTAMGEMR